LAVAVLDAVLLESVVVLGLLELTGALLFAETNVGVTIIVGCTVVLDDEPSLEFLESLLAVFLVVFLLLPVVVVVVAVDFAELAELLELAELVFAELVVPFVLTVELFAGFDAAWVVGIDAEEGACVVALLVISWFNIWVKLAPVCSPMLLLLVCGAVTLTLGVAEGGTVASMMVTCIQLSK
jgi:hypothetical protein